MFDWHFILTLYNYRLLIETWSNEMLDINRIDFIKFFDSKDARDYLLENKRVKYKTYRLRICLY